MKRLLTLSAVLAVAGAVAGCAPAHVKDHMKMWAGIDKAVAVLHGTEGHDNVHGTVTFTKMGDKLKVVADVEGLNPNQQHAIHIHEFGDCTDLNAKSAGGHYNPDGHPHGLPGNPERHAGDLGNLSADAAGKARLELTVDNISIAGVNNPIVGRAVVVHAEPDDGGQPTGNAGGRIACGTIGIAQQ